MWLIIFIAFIALSEIHAEDKPTPQMNNMPFDIGRVFPDSIDIDSNAVATLVYVHGSFTLALKHYPCMVDGIIYYVCVDSNHILESVIIQDQDFTSPEGLKVGDPICKAIPYSDYDIYLRDYYVVYCVAPSGWHIAASTNCGDTRFFDGKLIKNPPCNRSIFEEVNYLINLKIDYIWKRQGYSYIPRNVPDIHVIRVDYSNCQTDD